MKFTCDKNILSEGIQTVARAAATKSNLPAIEGILLVAENGTLTLTGYDFEMGIKTTFECDVEEEGDIVLSCNLFSNIVKKSTEDKITISCDEKLNCKIQSGITEFNIKGIESRDYPDFPSPSKENSIKIESELFCQMVDYVIYAVSLDEKRPAHTGVLIKLENRKLTMVALDGYRLAVCDREVDFEGDFSMIVPAKAMHEVRKIAADCENKITIYANRRYIIFNVGDYIVLSRLLEGEFIDYNKAIPQNNPIKATANVKDFINVIDRVSLLITERLKNPVKLNIKDNVILVKCTTELGAFYDEIPALTDGGDLEIGFNNKYLLDALKSSKKDELVFEFSGPLSPCVIRPKDSDDFTYLVLPVRFKND